MIRVLTVFGTRPEAIKLAPVVKMLASKPDRFESEVCVTAQHREMLDQAMQTLGIKADYDLDVMRHAQSPSEVAGTILKELPGVFARSSPDLLLVQGDTTTTFAASMAAYLNRIPVGHIEAGLRTGNLDHPFPEEMNRILTSQVASVHFAPTPSAREALIAEGIDECDTYITGNTVIDTLLSTVDAEHEFSDPALRQLDANDPIILITSHRRESFGKPLENICDAILALAENRADHKFILPVHPNPNVRNRVVPRLSGCQNVILCEPLAYQDFVNLMARAKLILTDSGGVQEEAPSLDVPVLVMRETTERREIVDAGGAQLVGMDAEGIVRAALDLLDNDVAYRRMASVRNPFGDGTAARQIVDIIAERMAGLDANAQP